MKNEVNITNILKEFEKEFYRDDGLLEKYDGDNIKTFIKEQIKKVVESCPCEERDVVKMDSDINIPHREVSRAIGNNEKCAEIKKWKESLLNTGVSTLE